MKPQCTLTAVRALPDAKLHLTYADGRDFHVDVLPMIQRALAIEQSGGYSHEYLFDWMHRHGLTQQAAADALGLSRRMLGYYLSGAKPLPRTVALACMGWEAQLRRAA